MQSQEMTPLRNLGPPDAVTSTSPPPSTVYQLLKAHAGQSPGAVAIAAPGRTPLTYAGLLGQVEAVGKTLNALTVGRNDPVAVVLPNGPEMAVAFLAIASGATCAPLNAAYRESEYDRYLADLQPTVLVAEAGVDSPATRVAQRRGIPIVTLSPVVQAEAGIFLLHGAPTPSTVQRESARPEDVALVLYTSGTTSRSKRVPLTHQNLVTAAHNVRAALSLRSEDRCLSVMPLHHIHGLVGALLSSLAAGASVAVTPGFDHARFVDWLMELHPTWYTAAPTIHEAALRVMREHAEVIRHCPLRFVRSSSAALPTKVMSELEDVFNAPVVEAYGMTEAAHQIASNPLPPGQRKSGSVGVAVGSKVAIMDGSGKVLALGEIGEIVIRGENVFGGYAEPDEAGVTAFSNGWFRTGDQGFVDSEGYLFITGRLKEIINRGGAKISPREIDEALLSHPAVAQAVTFAVPHATLGEDVAAAIVLRADVSTCEADIRAHVATRVADFKVPRRVVIVSELPKTDSGKLRRNGLAEALGLISPPRSTGRGPRDALEVRLTELWAKTLGIHPIGVQDNFYELGGDSLLATSLLAQLEKVCNRKLPVTILFQAATVEQLADLLRREPASTPQVTLVPLQPHGSKPPFFWVHGELSNALLPRHLGADQPLYGLVHQGLDGRRLLYASIEDIATHYLSAVRAVAPRDPYFLGGFCIGGVVAFEMAQQLLRQRQEVALTILLDAPSPRSRADAPGALASSAPVRSLHGDGGTHPSPRIGTGPKETLRRVLDAARWTVARTRERVDEAGQKVAYRLCLAVGYPLPPTLQYRYRAVVYQRALEQYVAEPYPGRLTVLNSEERGRPDGSAASWTRLAAGGVEVHGVPGKHTEIVFTKAQVEHVAERLKVSLARAQAAHPRGYPHGASL
jgi:acyl-CoA synthetase (AMP-forming)/AMP-acid ligase II/thioesterase domain-containing protein/acyl carrier protein